VRAVFVDIATITETAFELVVRDLVDPGLQDLVGLGMMLAGLGAFAKCTVEQPPYWIRDAHQQLSSGLIYEFEEAWR